MEFSPAQKAVIAAVDNGRNILVTGAAGTGKSTILRELSQRYESKLPVCASTGIAAVQVRGSTLHSWAGLGMGKESAEFIAMKILDGGKAMRRIQKAKRLAIDEISMIGGPLFAKLDEVFQIVRGRQEPFGGMQLVLFGDLCQLPPVTKTTEEARQRFAFQSPSWAGAKIAVAELTQVFRQEDKPFADALNAIRMGELNAGVKAILNGRYKQADADPSILPVIVHTTNLDVEAENEKRLETLPGQARTFRSTDYGSNQGAIAMLQKNCLAPADLNLKVGAQVMLLRNIDVERGFANGVVGLVTGFDRRSNAPIVKFRTGELIVEQASWEIEIDGMVEASRKQYPLRLAWSVTTHKSQGMTLDKIRVHLSKVFEFGQAYVALSRVRTKEGLFIEDGGRDAIRAYPDAVRFYRETEKVSVQGEL